MSGSDYQITADVNNGPPVVVANWTEAGIAIIVVALRLYTQARVVRKVHVEDYLIIASLVIMLVNTSLLTVAIHHGIGRHMEYLSPEQRLLAMKYEFLSEPFGVTSAALARISFAAFLLKYCIASRPWHWTVWSIIWIQAVGNIVIILLIFLQCEHVTALWDPNAGGTCWTPQVQVISGYLIGVLNATHDLLLAVLPINIIRNLTLALRVKVILGLVMCTSIFACGASIVKTVELGTLGDREDFTYVTTRFIIWLTIESYVLICAASVPALRPLLLSFTRRSTKKHEAPSVFRWSPTRSRTHIPTAYFRQDSVMDPDSRTLVTSPEALREGSDGDLEKLGHLRVETSEIRRETAGALAELQQPRDPDKAVIETTEITVTYEPAT